jgi:dTDP-4-dehydrorhamnose 3,5-epimerase
MGNITGVQLTPLKIIAGDTGSVLHALKQHETSYNGFGEAYFSTVNHNVVKGWKRHRRMLLNIVVPSGAIAFMMYDGREDSDTFRQTQQVVLSQQNYHRLTVPPGVWMAFKGVSETTNMLLNIASIPHDPTEADSLPLHNDVIPYNDFAV